MQCREDGGLSSGGHGRMTPAAAAAALGREERAIVGSWSW